MTDNYSFLKAKNEHILYDLLTNVESLYSKKDYVHTVADVRRVLESVIQYLCDCYNENYSGMSLNDYSKNLFMKHMCSDKCQQFKEDFYVLKKKANLSHHHNNNEKVTYNTEDVEDLLYRLYYLVCDYVFFKYNERITSVEYKLPEQKCNCDVKQAITISKNDINNTNEIKEKIKEDIKKEFTDKFVSMQQNISELQEQGEQLKNIIKTKNSQLEKITKELQEYKNAVEKSIAADIEQEEISETNYFHQGYIKYTEQEFDEAEELFNTAIKNNSNVAYSYYYLACIAEINDDVETAINYYTEAINISDSEPSYYNARANIYYISEQYEDAVTDWRKVLSLDADYCIDYFGLAYSEWITDENEDALNHYTMFIKNTSDSENLPHAYNNRGLIYKEQEMYSEAIKDYTKAIRIYKQYADDYDIKSILKTYNNRAGAYYALAQDIADEDFETAEEYFNNAIADWKEILKSDSEYDIDYFKKAYAENEVGLEQESLDDYTVYLSDNPDSAAAWNNRGLIYTGRKMFNEAVKDYTKAIKLNNNSPRYINNRADAYYKWARSIIEEDNEVPVTAQKYYKKAIADWKKVLKLDSDYNISYFNFARANYKTGNFECAKKYYTVYIDNNPTADDIDIAYNNRGVAYEWLEQYEEARDDYQKAHDLDENENLYIENLENINEIIEEQNHCNSQEQLNELLANIQAEYDIENYDEVIKICKDMLEQYNNVPDIYNFMALAYYDKDNFAEAVTLWTKVLKIDKNYNLDYWKKAYAETESKKYTKAIKSYTIYLKDNPDDASAYNNRAYAYQQNGKLDKAKQDYETAHKLKPKTKLYANNLKSIIEIIKQQNCDNEVSKLTPEQEIYNNAELLYKQGDYRYAFEESMKLCRQRFINIENKRCISKYLYEYAKAVLVPQERYKEIRNLCNELIVKRIRMAQVYNLRGYAYEKEGYLLKAKEDFERALKADGLTKKLREIIMQNVLSVQ